MFLRKEIFAKLRRKDCKSRILTGEGHAFKTKLRSQDSLLSPWKQEIQVEAELRKELTKLPRRGKLLTSLPWWWLRDVVVVVCWSLFYSNFVLTFTFPPTHTSASSTLLLLQGRASSRGLFSYLFSFFISHAVKTGLQKLVFFRASYDSSILFPRNTETRPPPQRWLDCTQEIL